MTRTVPRARGFLLVGLLVASVVIGTVLSVGAIGVASSSGATASFAAETFSAESGDVADIVIDLNGTDATTVVVDGQQNDYLAVVNVYDVDRDGVVRLSFNTHLAGRDGAAFDAGPDDVSVRTERSSDTPLPVGTYTLELQTNVKATDTATLTIEEPSLASFTVQTAPTSTFSSISTVDDVTSVATSDGTIANGDALLFRIEASGVYGALAAREGPPEQRFVDLLDAGAVDLTVRQTNADSGTAPKRLDFARTVENEGLKLIYSDDENVAYVVVDTKRAVFTRDGQSASAAPGDRFNSTLTLTERSGVVSENTSITRDVSIDTRTASFDTREIDGKDVVVVQADGNQTVTGTTTVAPGTNLTVQASTENDSSFVATQTTRVQQSGAFTVTFDFRGVTQGTSFVLTVPDQGFDTRAPGIVRSPSTASVTVADQKLNTGANQTVNIRSVELSDGGFVTVHDRTFLDSDNLTAAVDSVRGTSEYLEPGVHENVTVTLDRPYADNGTVIAMVHHDTNGNQTYDFVTSAGNEDTPYLDIGREPVVNSANVSVNQGTNDTGTENTTTAPPNGTATVTTTGTNTSTNVTSTSVTSISENATGVTTTTGSGPGFGALASMIAIVAVALIVLRRR